MDLAVWLDGLSLKFEGAWDKTLDVLRDELTGVQELEAFTREPAEHSGTWDPDNHEGRRAEQDLLGEYYDELRETHGDGSGEPELPKPVGQPVSYGPGSTVLPWGTVEIAYPPVEDIPRVTPGPS